MQTISFTPKFSRAVSGYRAVVYLVLALLLWLLAERQQQAVEWSGLAYFVLTPLVLHVLLLVQPKRLAQVLIYLLEWLCSLSVLLLCGTSTILCGAMIVVFLASHTALWGWRVVPWFALSAAVLAVLLEFRSDVALQADDALVDSLAALGCLLYVLTICAVAHTQAQQLMRHGQTLRSQNLTLLRYLPKELPAHLRSPGFTTSRRVWLTVAFVDLVGFSKATQELPAESLAKLLNDFLGSVNELVEQWDGSISKFLGDGVLCVFASSGQSQRRNAAVQAARCLSQLPALLASLNQQRREAGDIYEFAATIGVASGYCYAGDWGSSARMDYSVIGVPVNLAARLQACAASCGGILLDETTATLVSETRSMIAPIEVNLKGIGKVQAFPLMAQNEDLTVGCQRLLC